jgi:hypothetical protein
MKQEVPSMTEDKRFQSIVQEHPYLLDDIYKISKAEAKAINQEGFASPAELLAGAKEKYKELPPEGWALFEQAIKESTK